jgi:thioredoxin reductase
MSNRSIDDVAVVGAGTAGLQAALTLGRMRRRVVVLDTGRHRNDPADAMHNFLGHDGEHPDVLRAAARKDLAAYDTVELREATVVRITAENGAFTLAYDDGSVSPARRVVLATGVVDELPPLTGLAELFGGPVAHCPFCHGYEYADTVVGILGVGPHVGHMGRVLEPVARHVVVFADGEELPAALAEELASEGREVVSGAVSALSATPAGLRVTLADGATYDLGGLFVKPPWRQAAPFAEQLGLELSEVGAVTVDAMGRTSLPGVYAAGDMAAGPGLAMPMASVLTAAADGLRAGAACHMDLASG